jgi:hypothetical protein
VYSFAPALFGLIRDVAPDGAMFAAAALLQTLGMAALLLGRRR